MRRSWSAILAMVVAIAMLGVGANCVYQRAAHSAERRDAMELAKSSPTAAVIEALDACLARDPNDVEVLEAILETMIRVKMPAERIDPYSQRWCEVRPESVDALKLRLVVFGKLFRPASELIPILERLLELDSGNYEKRAELASAYFVVGRYRDAIRESSALLEKSPLPRDGLRLGIARAESASGNYAAASAELDSLLSEDPQRRDALLLRGIVYQQMGDDARAVEVLNRCKPTDLSERIILLHHLGLSLSRTNQKEEAERVFARLKACEEAVFTSSDAAQHPADMSFQMRAATALFAADEVGLAASQLQAAIARIGPQRAALVLLADCHERLGDAERARSLRAEAARLP